MRESPGQDAAWLRRCLNNLVSVMALPALWTGGEPSQISSTLADALRGMLHLEFVLVRLNGPDGGRVVETVRTETSSDRAWPAHEIGARLDGSLGATSSQWPTTARLAMGEADLHIATAMLGLQGELGVVVGGCSRPDFPEQTERLLLDVAANQAAMRLHQAQLLGVQRSVARELNERVAQRTGELAAANEDLKREIAERRRVEGALRESERESRSIIDTIPALAWSARTDGSPEFFNQHYLDFVGLSDDEARGWDWTTVVHPDDRSGLLATWRHMMESKESGEAEARLRRRDGEYRWFLIRASPLRDEAGHVHKWYGVNTDIEKRKQAEEALHLARAELAHVARVTALSTLTASIAHEVNQPLSAIVTNASTCVRMLDAHPPNIDGARETLRHTIRDSHRASEVVTRLRSLFSGKAFAPESVDLNEATQEVLALSSSELQRGRVVLRTELAERLPPVAGDRVQLQQVMLNLLHNAAEALSGVVDRPRDLLVRTERDGGGVRFSVRDSGVGIDRERVNALFSAFYTTKDDGMGIGLSVSRTIVDRHGGRIWAEPNVGFGATFSFSVPGLSHTRHGVG